LPRTLRSDKLTDARDHRRKKVCRLGVLVRLISRGGALVDNRSKNRDNLLQLVAELEADRTAERQEWGDLDDEEVALYVAGMGTAEERARVTQAMLRYPRVRALVRDLRPRPLYAVGFAVAAALILGAFFTFTLSIRSDPSLRELEIFVRRNRNDEGIIKYKLVHSGKEQDTPEVDPLGPHDDFHITAAFSRPTYWYLIWFDSAGQVNLVAHSKQPTLVASYPMGDTMVSVNPADPKGHHLLLLLAGTLPPQQAVVSLEQSFRDFGAPLLVATARGAGTTSETKVKVDPKYL
jgi:hypothetical protein